MMPRRLNLTTNELNTILTCMIFKKIELEKKDFKETYYKELSRLELKISLYLFDKTKEKGCLYPDDEQKIKELIEEMEKLGS
jgi:hypothetical protein